MPAPPLPHPGPWPLVSWDIRPYQDIDLRDWTVEREWVEVSASISLEPGKVKDRWMRVSKVELPSWFWNDYSPERAAEWVLDLLFPDAPRMATAPPYSPSELSGHA